MREATSAEVEAHRSLLQSRVESCLQALRALRARPPSLGNAAELDAAEQQCARLCDELHAAVMAELSQGALDSEVLGEQAYNLARSAPKRLKAAERREVQIQFRRGPRVPLQARYYRRRKGDALHREKGLFPAFHLLGIHDHTSPGAAALMARSACALASLEEAAACLRETAGLHVDIKLLRQITRRFGQRARAALPSHLPTFDAKAQGRSLVISVDGGRVRVRRDKAGARTRKGRRRFHTDWREPLLLHVGLLDAKGHLDRAFSPLIDGTLAGADELFNLLRLYLPVLLSVQPARILLIADGAPWIWKRFTALMAEGALGAVPVIQLIDFYHAVEQLGRFAELCSFWPKARRTRWRNHARQLLRAGKINDLLEDMQALLDRRPSSKALRRHQGYFSRNRTRFAYAWARRLRLPNGSGPMESAIRRVINLRLKGPGIFWHEDSAEAMLMIRSYYKAQRWEHLAKLACQAPLEALQ